MIKIIVLVMIVAVYAIKVSAFSVPEASQPVTETCLQCICQASSGCRMNLACEGDVCGMFGITRPFWVDAGSPTVDGGRAASSYGFPTCGSDPHCRNCTTNPLCAARAIQAYMTRFPQDCNGDGNIDCYDYMAIHRKGPYACMAELPIKYVHRFYQCMAGYTTQRQGC